MSHIEAITTLPRHQQDAARALMGHADERHVADAVHAGVPDPIVSYLSGMSVHHLHEVTEMLDERDMQLAGID